MKLLVSVVSLDEAKIALKAGADILDVKNPKEGSLGANFPWTIESIVKFSDIDVSAAIGDFEFKPGLASLAAFSLAKLGVKYVKIGFLVKNEKHALELGRNVIKSLMGLSHGVFVAYADYKKIGSISPFELINIASTCKAKVVMIDTLEKKGKNILSFINLDELRYFCQKAHESGLTVALAGSINERILPTIAEIGPDIIGVRGSVCEGGREGRISKEKIEGLKNFILEIKKH